ncbi:cell division protein FtsK [Bacillus sp. BGMRC 2118]|nr:cell division protein FtsK [Bacillus sp. BGMRC 2118]
MPTWIRKTLVVMFTILTFGLVTPPQIIITEAKSSNPAKENGIQENHTTLDSGNYTDDYISTSTFNKDQFTLYAIEKAKEQSSKKFGPVIEETIGDEFRDVILPKMEEVILNLSHELEEAQLQNLVISDKPTGGSGEKIFHIYDSKSGKDIIRFHVRRDHPPLEGYYFNFHYHTYQDQFQTHYELGSIYWSKNTPPKWNVS